MMNSSDKSIKTRTVRFHSYGAPSDVLQLDETMLPSPGPNRIRVRVHACGLNPADWALCQGLFAGSLPRGIGLEVSGTVDVVGVGVQDVAAGDAVFGPVDFADTASAGASEFAIMPTWARIPPGLDLVQAAALPMAVETAFRSLEALEAASGQTILIHGAGTTVGFAAVQMALLRGCRVVATAGATFADQLRAMGAEVTLYGEGMAERVLQMIGKSPDLILDTAPVSNILPTLVKIAGDPQHVLTVTDFAAAKELGVRGSFGDDAITLRYDVLGNFGQLAADGKFTVPVARTFPLEDWRDALTVSQSQHAHGKLLLLPASASESV